MRTINGVEYVEHGDVVRMRLHRGGGYNDPDQSIHTGGDWVEKVGVVAVKDDACPSLGMAGNPDGDVLRLDRAGKERASTCWVYFFDGDMQATNTRRNYEHFPDGVKTWLRQASPDELAWAEGPGPHERYIRDDPARRGPGARRRNRKEAT